MTFSKTLCALTLVLLGNHAAAEEWSKILECDSGQVWVDVDLSERRHLQLVIRNRAANNHLDEILARAGLVYVGGTDWERGYEGRQDVGYFGPSDGVDAGVMQTFRSFAGGVVGLERRSHSRYATSFEEHLVFKQENGGLRVEFTRTNINQCYQYNGRFGRCDDQGTFLIPNEYRGNWFFPDCRLPG